jgi:spore germination protein GerM
VRERLDAVATVFLVCADGSPDPNLRPAHRAVPSDGPPLRSALTQLFIGVTPDEAAAGLRSMFSPYTAGTLDDVTVADGVATLSWTQVFEVANNFSTSAGSLLVMSEIEATVFEFPEVTGIEFTVEGERWCGWETTCDAAPFPLRSR